MSDNMKDRITDRELEESLARAVEASAPDMIDDLMTELGLAGAAPERTEVTGSAGASGTAGPAGGSASDNVLGRRRWGRIAAACAAVLMVFAGGLSLAGRNSEAFAVVGLDVNPSVEISIDKAGKVVEAEAINEEGADVLADMDLKGSDVNVACNAVVGAMLKKGYLTDTQNSVLVSVRSKDGTRGAEIEKALAGEVDSYLGETKLSGAILAQYFPDDDEIERFAHDNNISQGKAYLIRKLAASGDPGMTEESLLGLSSQELILLAQEKNIGNEVSYGKADTSSYIGETKAEDIALAAAGVTRQNAAGLRTEYETDHGVLVYEVEFTVNGVEHEYDVDAVSGKIVAQDVDSEDAGDIDDKDDRDDDADDIDDDDDRYDDDDDRDDDDDHDDD